jgi:outer membrane receptor protein involved in Fe transport
LFLMSASALAFTTQAMAQGAPAADAGADEIIVTGSRVITNGNNSPAPVTVVSAAELITTQPTTVADGLNNLPVFSGSRGQASNVGNGGQNGAANTLNLRNLGSLRTLVLFDGHRVPPTTPDGLVNVDLLPNALLKRVDLVTGGVSAVYGSDAVAGVVNFVPDTTFVGLKGSAQMGISQRGDGRIFQGTLAAGKNIMDGRGHIEFSYQYYDDQGIFDKFTRPWTSPIWSTQGANTNASPYKLYQNTRVSTATYGGLITNGALANQKFGTDGSLSAFQNGTTIPGVTGVQLGGDGIYYNLASLKSQLRYHQAFGRFDYDVSDNVHFYLQGSYTSSFNRNMHQNVEFRNLAIRSTNPYLSQTVRDQLANAGNTTFNLSKTLQYIAYEPKTSSDQIYLTTGFKGDIGSWNYDLGGSWSQSKQFTRNPNNLNNARLRVASDAVKDSNGNIVCNVTLTNPGLYPGCVPINLFGNGSESADALRYILQETSFRAKTRQLDLFGSVSGSPFSTWAGEAKVAFSGEYRLLSFSQTSVGAPTDTYSCTGIIAQNCNPAAVTPPALYASNTVAASPRVSQQVYEGAVETEIPLLKDAPFAQELSLNGAARYTHYRTSGAVWTWKGGLVWHPNDQLTFRGTISRDIRAPTLADLFAPAIVNPANYNDPLTNANLPTNLITLANPNLKPEVARTITVGAVWRPAFLPNFSLSVDYFSIRISDAIQGVGGGTATVQQICKDTAGASPYCALIARPINYTDTSVANFPTAVYTKPINVASVKTRGVDVEANYRTGPVSLRALYTYQPTIYYFTPSLLDQEAAGVAFGAPNQALASPKHRVTLMGKVNVGDNVTIDVVEKWRSKLRRSPLQVDTQTAGYEVYADGLIGDAAYTNLNISFKTSVGSRDAEFFLNVQNLFDRAPEIASARQSGGIPGLFVNWPNGDDPVGRYFTAGVRFKM